MGETSWVLLGVDAQIRQRAIEEAERLAIPLADYLTEVVLRAAVTHEPPPEPGSGPEAAPPGGQAIAMGRRLQALERRLGLEVDGLDNPVHALDGSVCGLARRADETEAHSVDTADLLNRTLQDIGASVSALHERVSFTEARADTLARAQEAMGEGFAFRCAELAGHAATVEDVSREASAGLSAGLHAMRAVAEAAAEQTSAAISRAIEDLRAAREALEARLHDSVSETRLRIQAAFADVAQRTNALAERVTGCERLVVSSVEQMRLQVADLEDGVRAAREETAESLRQAGARLAAEFARTSDERRSAIESVHHELSAEIAELRERQDASLTRIAQADAAANGLIHEVTSLRQTLYARASHGEEAVRALLVQAQFDWDARFDALVARLTNAERVAAGGAQGPARAGDRAIDQRVLRLEAAAEREENAHALAALRGQIAAVAAQLDAKRIGEAEDLDGLRARVIASEVRAGEAADEIHGGLHMMGRLTAQSGRAEERLHKLELALADLQPEMLPNRDAAHIQAISDVEQRMSAFEQRQDAAIQRLHADITRFVSEQAKRLEALERTRSEPHGFDVASEFETLRRRIEERVLGVEQHSARTLEQAADAMDALRKRFDAGAEDIRQSA